MGARLGWAVFTVVLSLFAPFAAGGNCATYTTATQSIWEKSGIGGPEFCAKPKGGSEEWCVLPLVMATCIMHAFAMA